MKKRITALLVALMLLLTAIPALADVDKKEMVYVLSDASGQSREIVVSERLYNREGLSQLEDMTTLEDIDILSEETTCTQSGHQIIWNAGGQEVRYEGRSTQDLPFDISIRYTLDGQDIAPEKLAGQSGQLTMTFDYASRLTGEAVIDGQREEMPIPFLMMTVLLTDEDVFSQLEVTNGRIVEIGDRTLVVLYALPGLAEALQSSLKSDDIDFDWNDIPASAALSAEVSQFSFSGSYTLVASASLAEGNLDASLSFDLDKISSELQDAVDQLLSGSGELYDGAGKLYDGLCELDSNSEALRDGARQVLETVLETANSTLAQSKGDFSKLGITLNTLNSDNYVAEIDRLQREMLDNLEDYVIAQADEKLTRKVNEAVYDEVASQVRSAAHQQVEAKVTQAVREQISAQVNAAVRAQVEQAVRNPDEPTLSATVEAQMSSDDVQAQIQAAIEEQMASDSVKALIEQKIDETLSNSDVQAQINATIQNDYEAAIREGVQAAWNSAYEQIKSGYADSIRVQITESVRSQAAEALKDSVPEDGSVTLEQLIDAYMNQIDTQQTIETQLEAQLVALTNQNVNAEQLVADKLSETRAQMAAYVRENTLRPQVEAAVRSEVTAQVEQAARQKVIDSIRNLSDEQIAALVDQKMSDPQITAQIEAALNEQMDSENVKSLIEENIDEQMKSDEVKALIEQNISEQIDSSNVKNIIDEQIEINRSSREYLDGVAEALEENGKNGAAYQALVTLRQTIDDIHTFYQGVIDYTDGVSQAAEGAKTLYEGVGTLKDGLEEFSEKAIDKLLEALYGDLPALKDRLEALVELAGSYTSYAGLAEGQEGSVHFIVRTAGI